MIFRIKDQSGNTYAMPELIGPRGKPGVYYGSVDDAPDDALVVVDPSGGSDTVSVLYIRGVDGSFYPIHTIKGNDGVGIATIEQTTTAEESGGVNVITITYTNGNVDTFTVKNGEPGVASQFWTTTTAPTTPNYTFTVANLTGGTLPVRVGDIIFYSYYRYTVSSVNDTTVLTTNRQSLRGSAGSSVGISSITESTESSGENVVTFSDGKTLTVQNGRRGNSELPIMTAPSSFTDVVGGVYPKYRIVISIVRMQADVDEVYPGDSLLYSYYRYPVIYVDNTYVYCRERVSVRGETPVKGTDYFTEDDINEIVNAVYAKVADGNEVAY